MDWWLPVMTAGGIALMVALLHVWNQRRYREQTSTYRLGYVQLVSKIELVTRKVNHMAPLAQQVGDAKVLDYYESCLKSLENLLTTITQIPNFGDDQASLRGAFVLAGQCDDRVNRTYEAFQQASQGKSADYKKLFNWKLEAEPAIKGCYFCSRPYLGEVFRLVTTKVNGATIKVHSCNICREELESTKKVKVLYFMKDGQPVHWSQVTEYTPSEHYWNLNKRQKVYQRPKLELVHSQRDGSER